LSIPQDPWKVHYGCGVATVAQVDTLSGSLAALEPRINSVAAQTTSAQASLAIGSNQTATLRAEVDALTAALAALRAKVQELQKNASNVNATDPGIAQQLVALAAADASNAQKMALLEAANRSATQDLAALQAASQQCACGAELSAVNATLQAIQLVQGAEAAATSLVNTTIKTLISTVAADRATLASVNATIADLTATVANASAIVSAIDLSTYAKTADLANIDAASLGGVPASRYLRSRVVLFAESSTQRNGALGGRSGADALCTASTVRPAGLVQVRAFLSVSAADQIKDFPALYGVPTGLPIEGLSGILLASNFTSSLPNIRVTLTAAGVLPAAADFWSGSAPDGTVGEVCTGWSTGAADVFGTFSISDRFSQFLRRGDFSCDSLCYLMCIAF
jgi:hypothetical protein